MDAPDLPTEILSEDLADLAATTALGARLGETLRPGDLIALHGGLGAGKTTLARAIIRALCGQVEVPSPTYTLVQTYAAPEFEVWHADLYRLHRPENVWELGLVDALDEGAVALVEWPEKGDLPSGPERLDVHLGVEPRGAVLKGAAGWAKRLA